MIAIEIEKTSGAARAGFLHTPHGVVPTPAFMPVGTQGAVKALAPQEVADTGARLLIANTYHLWLRPGPDVVERMGGLHEFMRWPHGIATDSGGFQAFSLAARTKLTENGFEFSSHLDGSRKLLTPEEAMRIQGALGSDLAMQLDVCPSADSTAEQVVAAVKRTTRWAERCIEARRPGQGLFAIVQGGTDIALRVRHARELAALPVEGLALGGFSVGEPPEAMHRVLAELSPALDGSRPRYMMGVGTPSDLVRAIGCGVDLFDCVLPTRNARNGQAFVKTGKLRIKNARYRDDARPLESECDCSACASGFGRSYLRHLYIAGEILAHRLLTLHNLRFYGRLVAEARKAVLENDYPRWAAARLAELSAGAEPEGPGP